MRYLIYGKNLDVSDALKQAITDKFRKLDKFFTADTDVHVTLSVQKDTHKVEATIPMRGTMLRAEQSGPDMYVAIERTEEKLERMVRKYKTKIAAKTRATETFTEEFLGEDVENHDSIQITKSKRFNIKPMDEEDACVQMELIGHDFYVFRNARTFEVNVVYKRKDGSYGIIEPEF